MSEAKPPPTRMVLTIYKAKHKGAKKGYELLKKKADALKVRFRDIAKAIHDAKLKMTEACSSSFFSMTQAQYAAGDIKAKVLEGNMEAKVRVDGRQDNIAGVKMPIFNELDTNADSAQNDQLGLAGGGRAIQNCREKFGILLSLLIKLASLQTSFLTVDEALKVTNRRVNALENVTLPKIEGILSYINKELDELEREDFTRLKKVKENKAIKLKQNELEAAERAAKAGVPLASGDNGANLMDGYDQSLDEDIVM